MAAAQPVPVSRPAGITRARYVVVLMLFIVSAVNYADRATLSIAGDALSRRGPAPYFNRPAALQHRMIGEERM